jgi:hypothetical protein
MLAITQAPEMRAKPAFQPAGLCFYDELVGASHCKPDID